MTKLLIVEAGQSNAIDLGVAASVTNYPGITATVAAVTIVDHNSGAQDPPQFVDDGPRGLSPRTKIVASQPIGTGVAALVTGRILNAVLPSQIIILRMALDSSGLEDQWLNPGFPVSGDQWMEQYFDTIESTQATYDCLLQVVNWKQGEHDANGSPDATDYLPNMRTFRDMHYARFGRKIGFAIGGLSTLFSGGSAGVIRTAQATFVAETSRSILVDPAGCPFRDTAHYSDNGYALLGHRFGLADRALIPNLNAAPFDIDVGESGGGGSETVFPPLANATTIESIRDRIIAVIEGLTPSHLANTRFVRYRNEGRGDFVAWSDEEPSKSLRRFQVRDLGLDQPPAITNSDISEDEAVFEIRIAYGMQNRYGKYGALDRDDIMREDQYRVEQAVGLCGRANFIPPNPDACWRSEGRSGERSRTVRIDGESVTWIVITQVMTFQRQRA